jgi:hypothetical protein
MEHHELFGSSSSPILALRNNRRAENESIDERRAVLFIAQCGRRHDRAFVGRNEEAILPWNDDDRIASTIHPESLIEGTSYSFRS